MCKCRHTEYAKERKWTDLSDTEWEIQHHELSFVTDCRRLKLMSCNLCTVDWRKLHLSYFFRALFSLPFLYWSNLSASHFYDNVFFRKFSSTRYHAMKWHCFVCFSLIRFHSIRCNLDEIHSEWQSSSFLTTIIKYNLFDGEFQLQSYNIDIYFQHNFWSNCRINFK